MKAEILHESADRITVQWAPDHTETYTRRQREIANTFPAEHGFGDNLTWEEFRAQIKERVEADA
jgi:hypothetical protein